MARNEAVRRGFSVLIALLLVALVTYQGPVIADETDGGFSVDDFNGNAIGPRTLVGGPANQCGWTDLNSMTTGAGTMRVDLQVPDTRGCHFASIGVRWTAVTSVNIEQGNADRIVLKYRDVLPNTPSAVTFGLELVDVNGRKASVGGLSRNGGPAGDFLTIRYAPGYEGDVSYLTFQGGFDKSRVKTVTLLISATASDQNVSVTFEGIGTNVGEPAYVGPAFSVAPAYVFPANTETTHSFTATGFPAPDVSWTGKPAWMTITTSQTSAGRQVTMSGNPGAAYADHSLAFHADVANSLTADAAVRVVVPSPVNVTTTSGDRTVGQAGPFTLGTVSATPAATSVTNSSNIPPGTALAISGNNIVLTGTPTTAGTYNMTATVGNEFRTALFERRIVIGAAPQVTAPTTQYFLRGEAIAPLTPTVTGYPAPHVDITGLPAGLSAAGGVISGTPTDTSTTTVTVTADNDFGADQETFDIAVGDAPTMQTAGSFDATAGTPVDIHLSTTGTPTSITASGLPAGLVATLTAGVVEIVGTPLRPASAAETVGTATIEVSNAFGSARQDVTWTVSASPLITGDTSVSATAGVTMTPVVITLAGYPDPSFNFSDADGNGVLLPMGLMVHAAAGKVTISGTPLETGTETVRITADNGVGAAAIHDVTVTAVSAPVFADSAPRLEVAQGASGQLTVDASGYPAPVLTVAGSLPSWLSFDAASGVFTATPGMAVDGTFGPYRVDADNGAGTASANMYVDVISAPTISPSTPVMIPHGAAADETIATVGGYPVPTVEASGLPAGLSLSQSGNTVSVVGTPTAAGGEYTVTLTASRAGAETAEADVVVTVTAAPSLSYPSSADFIVGEHASLTATLGGFPRPTVAVVNGSLPAGLTLNAATGEISGTPTTPGPYSVTLMTQGGPSGSSPALAPVTIRVGSAPSVTLSPLAPTYQVGSSISTTVTLGGFPRPTLEATGLPPGLSLVDNVVAGTPTRGGVYPVTLTYSNFAGEGTAEWLITVNERPRVTPPPVIYAALNEPMIPVPLTLSGYPVPTVSTVVPLPPGVSLEADADGVSIVGTPTSPGSSIIIFRAHQLGRSELMPETTTIHVGSPPQLGADAAVEFPPNLTTVHTVDYQAGDDTGTLSATGMPAWMSFDPATGQLTGSPTAADLGHSGVVTVTATSVYGTDTMDISYAVVLEPSASPNSGSLVLTAGSAVSEALSTVTGFPIPAVSAPGLPDGLHVDLVAGVLMLTGSTTDSGSHTATVTLTNGVGAGHTSTWSIDVIEAPAVSVPADQTLVIGAPITLPITASGYPSPLVTVTGLPAGLTWSPGPGGGTISGTPTTPEVATVEVTASNTSGPSASATFTLTTEHAVITVAPGATDVPAGSLISVSASGFQPGEAVDIELHSTPVLLASVYANSLGEVHTTVTIPAATQPGSHQLVVTGATGASGSSPLTVHMRAVLASTGTSIMPSVAGAVALMLVGLGLIVLRRSSRPE